MAFRIVSIATVFVFAIIGANAQTSNTDICLRSGSNKNFDKSWCNKLTRTEGCRLGIVNLLFAASEGDIPSLKKFHSQGMDMSLADYDQRTALHLTAAEGHLEATKFLLERARVPSKPRDRWGNLPIDEAKRFGHQKVVRYLQGFRAQAVESAEADVQSAEDNSSPFE